MGSGRGGICSHLGPWKIKKEQLADAKGEGRKEMSMPVGEKKGLAC